jgi:hypothetical protein
MKMERQNHKQEKDDLMNWSKGLQKEQQSVKVSAACIWLCRIVGMYYFWLITGPYE